MCSNINATAATRCFLKETRKEYEKETRLTHTTETMPTCRNWEDVELPLHLSTLRRILSSKYGAAILNVLHMAGIVNAVVVTYANFSVDKRSLGERFNCSIGLEILTYFWVLLNLVLCPLTLFYCQQTMLTTAVQQLLFDISMVSSFFITGIEYLAHQNLSVTIIALILYIIFFGQEYAGTFAVCTCVPLYIGVTVVMLELESLRQHSQNYVTNLSDPSSHLHLAELKDGYMKVWKDYNATSDRNANFLIFLISYVFTSLLLCLWWAYTLEAATCGLLGFVFVLFNYFIQVFFFAARANEMGLNMAAGVAEYILLRGNFGHPSSPSVGSSEQLNLLISCVSLARPEVSLHGFVLRYRGAVVVTGGIILGVIPRLFLSGILYPSSDDTDVTQQ